MWASSAASASALQASLPLLTLLQWWGQLSMCRGSMRPSYRCGYRQSATDVAVRWLPKVQTLQLAPGMCSSLQQPTAEATAVHIKWHPLCPAACLTRGVGTLQRLPRAVTECGLCAAYLAVCPSYDSKIKSRALPQTDLVSMCLQVEQLQKGLCGVSRPHFFRGVATVSVPAVLLWWAGSPTSSAEVCLPPVVLLKGGRCRSHAAQPCHKWTTPLKSCRCLLACCLPCNLSCLHSISANM